MYFYCTAYNLSFPFLHLSFVCSQVQDIGHVRLPLWYFTNRVSKIGFFRRRYLVSLCPSQTHTRWVDSRSLSLLVRLSLDDTVHSKATRCLLVCYLQSDPTFQVRDRTDKSVLWTIKFLMAITDSDNLLF